MEMSKTEFKAHALEVFRSIEKTGEPIIITDHGKPKIEIRKVSDDMTDPLLALKNTVLNYVSPTKPISVDDWENV